MAPTAAVRVVKPATAAVATPLATVPRALSMPPDFCTPPSTPAAMESPKAAPACAPAPPNSPHILLANPSMDGMSVMHAEPTLVAIPSS